MFNKWRTRQPELLAAAGDESTTPTTLSTSQEHALSANRPSATTTTDSGLSDVVNAARRIAALRQREEIYRVATGEAIALTNAEAGAFVATPNADPNLAQFVFQSHPQLFEGTTLGAGLFRKTLVDRAAVCEVAVKEPTLALSPIAMAAVPAIAGGGVVGLLIVLRDSDLPFSNNDLEVLNLLAPAAGAAHLAAASSVEKEETDAITKLGNRRRLDRDFLDLTREGLVGLAMVKIDFFNEFRQVNGAEATEDLIRQVALTVAASIRPGDVAYRSDTDTFGVLLPDATKDETTWVAERVRQEVAAATIAGMEKLIAGNITVSIGVTTGDNDDPQMLTERALAAVQEAQEAGHDQVVADEAN